MKKTLANCNEEAYLLILHLLRVKLRCKLHERLQRVTVVPLEDVVPECDHYYNYIL